MNQHGQVVHEPDCGVPINEHTGNEPCLKYVAQEEVDHRPTILKRGPSGTDVADHYAEYVRAYGHASKPIHSMVEDRRDNRDPTEVGLAYLASRNGA